ncbi:MAG: hypothetical protein HC799_18405 [Limnothrix sp. RL_2_0]|nr:hypothetical protein [Limnothrix sp. RL_2_0]
MKSIPFRWRSLTDVGVTMRAIITGTTDNQLAEVTIDFVHENTAIAPDKA